MDPVRLGKAYFLWMRRTINRTFDNDPRYRQQDFVLEQIIDVALRSSVRLDSTEPTVGWVKKRYNEDYYQPCGEFADDAIPAWIWTAK